MEDLGTLLSEAAQLLRTQAEYDSYGFTRTDNPHDFKPDAECATADEIATHQLACDAWDRGEYVPAQPPTREEINASIAAGALARGVEAVTIGTDDLYRVTFAPWGPGTYVIRDEELMAMAERLEAYLAASRGFSRGS